MPRACRQRARRCRRPIRSRPFAERCTEAPPRCTTVSKCPNEEPASATYTEICRSIERDSPSCKRAHDALYECNVNNQVCTAGGLVDVEATTPNTTKNCVPLAKVANDCFLAHYDAGM